MDAMKRILKQQMLKMDMQDVEFEVFNMINDAGKLYME